MSESYHVDDFQTHVRAKINASEVLRKELKKTGFMPRSELETESLVPFLDEENTDKILTTRRGLVIGVSGGVSDAYQPAEEKFRITRQILETLLDFEMPVFILTKSSLVLRDLDILKEIHKRAFVNVCFTITHHNDEIRSVFEPKSPSTWERFAALKKVRRAGLYGGVMAMPIIPGIGTNEENIRGLVRETKRAGGEFIQFADLTLKPGRQKEYFMRVVRHRFPEYHKLLTWIYANNNRYGNPIYGRLPIRLLITAHRICQEEGLNDRSIRHCPPWETEVNNLVLSRLLDIIFIRNFVLGERYGQTNKLRTVAERIERGVEDLSELQRNGRLVERLDLNQDLEELINTILRTGGEQQIAELWSKAHSSEKERTD